MEVGAITCSQAGLSYKLATGKIGRWKLMIFMRAAGVRFENERIRASVRLKVWVQM